MTLVLWFFILAFLCSFESLWYILGPLKFLGDIIWFKDISNCFQENIFEWQFAIRGPRDTEFEDGIYHGRIQLPAEYPFKPPSFMLLTVQIVPP